MAKTVVIRNVPGELHRALSSRAAKKGMSLSEFLLDALCTLAERPTMEEIFERLDARRPVQVMETSALAVRAERGRPV